MEKRKNSSKEVRSLKRGLMILESFTPKRYGLSLSQVSKIIRTPKSTTFRLLNTLNELNYIKYDGKLREYYPGPRILSLGFSILQTMEIREIAKPYLEKLARECERTVNLAVLDKIDMVYIERIKIHNIRDFYISIGDRIPVYNTAIGKAVLAYLEKGKLYEIFREIKKIPGVFQGFGKNGSRLIKELETIRINGYALNDEEFLKGIRAIAVPIFTPQGISYGINIVVPSGEVSVVELQKYFVPKLIEIGKEISEATGYKFK
jgi:IclR family pca regulon transcriptional regulator